MICAISLWAYASWAITRIDWQPLDKPVELTDGHENQYEFTPNLSTDYYFEISFDRNIRWPEHRSKAKSQSDFTLAYQILQKNLTVVTGVVSNENICGRTRGDERRSIILAKFPLITDVPCTLKIKDTKGLPYLKNSNPTVVVKVNSLVWKDYYSSAAIKAHILLLVFVVGLVYLVRAIWLYIKKTKQNK